MNNTKEWTGENDYAETYENAIIQKHFINYRNQEYCLIRVFHGKNLMVETLSNAKGDNVINSKTYNGIIDRLSCPYPWVVEEVGVL
jgi:hypothetical protein